MTNKQKGDQHRAKAQEAKQKAVDSFERSDTDGFVSQWASQQTGDLEDMRAKIADNGGKWGLVHLVDGDRVVDAWRIEGNFGPQWLLSAVEAQKYGRRYLPWGPTSRIQKKLGLSQKEIEVEAYARFEGTGTGLSGTCYVVVRHVHKPTWLRH